jgi:hypothetical protein
MSQIQLVTYASTQGIATADTTASPNTIPIRGNDGSLPAEPTLQALSQFKLPFAAVVQTNSATLDATATVWKFDATTGAKVATLPPATGAANRVYTVIKVDTSTNTVSVSDGTNTLGSLSLKYGKLTTYGDGTNWY